jgi:AraC-like DNA-binding protein
MNFDSIFRLPRVRVSSADADNEGPILDIEETFLMEELALSMRASDIIKKSHLLNRLQYFRDEPAPPSHKKIGQWMPSNLDSQTLRGHIVRKLEDERVFLNEDLSLASFAHELALEPHQLSRFLNILLRTTFTRLINSYRVNEAKALLIDKPGLTILDIAFSAGFNSKASFNRVFKKATGITPSAYRLKMKCSR